MNYTYNEQNLLNNEYECTPSTFERENTQLWKEFDCANIYRNLVINNVTFTKGEYQQKDFKTKEFIKNPDGSPKMQPYEILNIELISKAEQKKVVLILDLVKSTDRARMDELIFFTNKKGFTLKDIDYTNQNGEQKTITLTNDFDGYTVDMVLDRFTNTNKLNRMTCKCLGVFKKGKSARETINKTEVLTDLNACLANCKQKIGESIFVNPLAQNKAITPIPQNRPLMPAPTQKFGSPTPSIPQNNQSNAANGYYQQQQNYQQNQGYRSTPMQQQPYNSNEEIPF